MGFKDMVAQDNSAVFLNTDEFGESRNIAYDGEIYANVPCVLAGTRMKKRGRNTSRDHAQGLYAVSDVLHCRKVDLGGKQPEQGQRMKIGENGGTELPREFYVAASSCSMGMLRVELEAIDE